MNHLRQAIERRNSKGHWAEPFAGKVHDYSRPMRDRANSRRTCGPYEMRPSSPKEGKSFYMESRGGLRCASHGAFFDLRIEEANDHLRGSRLSHITGYYCEDDDGDTLQPIILRLPHGRGFLSGYTMGAGMISSVETDTIWDSEEEAARRAHDFAAYWAEENRFANERERRELARFRRLNPSGLP